MKIKLFKKKVRSTFYRVYFRDENGVLYMEKWDRVGYNNFMVNSAMLGLEILGVTIYEK